MNVFNQTAHYGGSMKAGDVTIFSYDGSLNTANEGGQISGAFLVQNLNLTFQQQMSRIYDLANVDYTYYVAGKCEGQFTLAHILGPQGLLTNFVRDYGDVCNLRDFGVRIEGTDDGGGCLATSGEMTCSNAIINNLTLSIAVADFMLNENISGMYTGLQIK